MVRKNRPVQIFDAGPAPRLCSAYCNAERCGGKSGPLCPHCDRIEGLLQSVERLDAKGDCACDGFCICHWRRRTFHVSGLCYEGDCAKMTGRARPCPIHDAEPFEPSFHGSGPVD